MSPDADDLVEFTVTTSVTRTYRAASFEAAVLAMAADLQVNPPRVYQATETGGGIMWVDIADIDPDGMGPVR